VPTGWIETVPEIEEMRPASAGGSSCAMAMEARSSGIAATAADNFLIREKLRANPVIK
jgi:hypothetical protein